MILPLPLCQQLKSWTGRFRKCRCFHCNAVRQRAPLAATRALFERLRAGGVPLDTLSMGMSADLEAAVFEGSTMVRIGTAIFGERERKHG